MEGRKTKEYNAVPRQLLARKDKTKIAKIVAHTEENQADVASKFLEVERGSIWQQVRQSLIIMTKIQYQQPGP